MHVPIRSAAGSQSAPSALPQAELQLKLLGNSCAAYIAAAQVKAGREPTTTYVHTGEKYGPLKDGDNLAWFLERQFGRVYAVSELMLGGHLT